MSRVGKKPIIIAQGVKVEKSASGGSIKVSGPLGSLQMDCHPKIRVKVDESAGQILVENERPQNRQNKQLHGTMRALIANMVNGVSEGFEKKMEIYGTGFNIRERGGKLVFQVGFSHPVERAIPKGIKVSIDVEATRGNDVPAKFTLSGIDKCLLGQFAANIRRIRPPEPYKGKGIRYADEHVRRKVGKAFTSGAA
jgi:large subunit ribosomal protein L6